MNSCVNSRRVLLDLICTGQDRQTIHFSTRSFHIFHSLITLVLARIFTILRASNIARRRFISDNHGRVFGISGTNIPFRMYKGKASDSHQNIKRYSKPYRPTIYSNTCILRHFFMLLNVYLDVTVVEILE